MKRAGRIWRWLLLALLVMTGIICLGGCGQDRSMTEDGRVRLSYAIWDKNQQPAMQAIVDEFEAENPDIKVDIQIIPWNQYWTKLEAGAMSETMPDVFWMHPQSFVRYASNDILLDLTGQLGDDYDPANYPQGLSDFYTYDGHQYAVPKDYDTVALWYNKKLFDAKGIPYPDETWDWAKLVEVAQQLTDADNGIYGFLAPPDQQALYYDFVYQNGGEILNADKTKSGYREPATQEAIQFAVDLSQKYHVSPTVQQFADMSREQYFQSGRAAMAFFGSWMLADFKKNDYLVANCDIAPLPRGRKRATIYSGLGNAASAQTKHPAEARRFLAFLGSRKAMELQAQAVIPAYKGTEQEWLAANDMFHASVYTDGLDYAVIFPNSATREKWMLVETEILSKAWSGAMTVPQACAKLADRVDDYLATERE